MKRILYFGLMLALLLGVVGIGVAPVSAKSDDHPQTYTVIVGAESVSRAIDIMSFFPATVHVHVGDTVRWKQNTFEIHTVTFLAGAPMPDLIVPAPSGQPSPLMLNPQVAFPVAPAGGLYDGSMYANSGIMSKSPGQPTSFELTLTKEGTFKYICLVHGMMMSGEIIVEPVSAKIPSPSKVSAQARREIVKAWKNTPDIRRAVKAELQPDVHNPDGTTTHQVLIGFSVGVYDFMRFFPSRVSVRPGDTVVWSLSKENAAPHTITFLNGTPDQPLVVPVPQPQGPPLLLFNPAILFPSPNAGQPLTNQGYFNSGLLNPGDPSTSSFSAKIGDVSGLLPYICLLHDESGMHGTLIVRSHSDKD
ncbi:MAG TPA: plastocyanin/azurin family copper-binding protein [Anaerolineaceae bacterium]|nr:plastocyanin/azurin family copper-binding protein [Anaerolineaceae bacterium]